jgi:toxin ParE1/3/4
MTYKLTQKASADIRHLYSEGIRLFGPAQADRYCDRIEQALQLLASSPHLARERKELSPPARIHPVGSHVIV